LSSRMPSIELTTGACDVRRSGGHGRLVVYGDPLSYPVGEWDAGLGTVQYTLGGRIIGVTTGSAERKLHD
jgi:hypothetical protein